MSFRFVVKQGGKTIAKTDVIPPCYVDVIRGKLRAQYPKKKGFHLIRLIYREPLAKNRLELFLNGQPDWNKFLQIP